MNLYKFKSITNGLRHQLKLQKSLLFKSNNLIKVLSKGIKKNYGRSTLTGNITVRHKGGGCSPIKYRIINTSNNFFYSIIIGFVYDPRRNSFLSLNFDLLNKNFFYNLGISKLTAGSVSTYNLKNSHFILGSTYFLNILPSGSFISNIFISKYNKKSSTFIKAAGSYGILCQKSYLDLTIKFPSKTYIKFSILLKLARATLGVISNSNSKFVVLGKAGKNRLRGKRPSVRGIAMNPVDHPHGGRTNGGCHFKTPWGKPTKGKKTVYIKNNYITI